MLAPDWLAHSVLLVSPGNTLAVLTAPGRHRVDALYTLVIRRLPW
ncbi:hypothetical protein ACIQVK_19785 [Streptomyces sp. NPDC090493]